jgi:ABC-type transport system substrate-binding protein
VAVRGQPRRRPHALVSRPGPRSRGRWAALLLTLAVAACGLPVPPTAPAGSATPSPTPSPTVAPTPSPTPTPVPTLTVAIDGDLAGGFSDAATGADAIRVADFIHDGLYALDARLRPVPVLAVGPPRVSADGRTWTVALRDDAHFADGAPLTAQDVVLSYELARSAQCPYRPALCLSGVLDAVAAVDASTVAFTLTEPLAAFATTGLELGIEQAAAIETAGKAFVAGLGDVTVADTAGYLNDVAAEGARPSGPDDANGRPTVDTARLRADGEALLATAGVAAPDPADHQVDGALDEAGYVAAITARVRAVDAQFTSRPLDALAAAYPFLASAAAPVTTGPFQLATAGVSGGVPGIEAGDIVLAANPDYVLGRPSLDRIVLRRVPSEAAATTGLRDGTMDWRPGLTAAGYDAVRDDPAVQVAAYPDFGFYGLTFNLHPEADGLFLDRNLRQALSLCFDHAAAARAAVGDAGMAIDTEIPTMSWAYPTSGLATYDLDPDRATGLIEAAGWTLGDDGVYERDGRRLSTVVPVREDAPERAAWLRAVGTAVRRCGIELKVAEVPFSAILRMLAIYPHVNAAAPDAGRSFDAYFGGLDTGVDPDPFRLYHSTECTSAERPDTYNFGCYQEPAVDRLIDAARREPELTRRALLYQQYATRISTDLPVIYAWSDLVRDGIAASVGTTAAAGLQLDTPTWPRPLERLTNVR